MLENLSIPTRTFTCRVKSVAMNLNDADKKILETAVMSEEWPISTLETSLRALDIVLSARAIKRHRSKSCSCWNA
jgi:hypothetical protein